MYNKAPITLEIAWKFGTSSKILCNSAGQLISSVHLTGFMQLIAQSCIVWTLDPAWVRYIQKSVNLLSAYLFFVLYPLQNLRSWFYIISSNYSLLVALLGKKKVYDIGYRLFFSWVYQLNISPLLTLELYLFD